MSFDPHVERKALVDGFLVWASCKSIVVEPHMAASKKRVEAMGLEKSVERLMPGAILEDWRRSFVTDGTAVRYVPKTRGLCYALDDMPGWILARDEKDAGYQAYEKWLDGGAYKFVESARFLELPECPFYFPTSHRKLKVCTWGVYKCTFDVKDNKAETSKTHFCDEQGTVFQYY